MPTKAKIPCVHNGCPNRATERYCDDHKSSISNHDRYRGSASSRGYDAAWQQTRKQALKRDLYLCLHCKNEGRVSSAKDVDHIIPISTDPGKRLDLANLQSLCRSCHNKKTSEDLRRYNVAPTQAGTGNDAPTGLEVRWNPTTTRNPDIGRR